MTHYSESASDAPSSGSADGGSMPAALDWAVGAGIALFGLLLVTVGAVLKNTVDRALITDLVRDFGTRSTVFTEAETIDLAVPTLEWTSIGLLFTGGVLLLGAGVYVYLQRTHRHRLGTDRRASNFKANAVAGAVTAAVLSFVPFSPALGGAAAGYLEHEASGRSTVAGAAAGLLGVLPVVLIGPFVLAGVANGASAIGDETLPFVVAGVGVVIVLFSTVVGACLGAVGGYAGGIVARD